MLAWGCPYPAKISATYVVYILGMLALFANFYVRKHCCGRTRGKGKTPAPVANADASNGKTSDGEGGVPRKHKAH